MEILILLVLILINGFFSLSEIALVSSKETRLEQYRQNGSKGALIALKLRSNSEKFLSSVIKLGPKRVVYVSCNPETLARDLKYLTRHGYQAVKIQPVDNFPFCDHIETVVKLVRKK